MNISIISVNYNNHLQLIECIDKSLIKLNDVKGLIFEFVVVDNDSTDNSFTDLKEYYKKNKLVKIYKAEKNGGFGYGCNLGAKKSLYEYLWFLNSDAWVTEIKDLDILSKILESGSGMVATSSCLNDGSPTPQGVSNFSFLYFVLSAFRVGRLIRLLPEAYRNILINLFDNVPGIVGKYFKSFKHDLSDKPLHAITVGGASFFIKKEIFNSIGKFDENFFVYDEDGDLSIRLHHNRNYNYIFPKIKVEMYLSGTTSIVKTREFWNKTKYNSRKYLIKKHFKGLKKYLLLLITFITKKLL
jgi:GT2 family glycosyltransferase